MTPLSNIAQRVEILTFDCYGTLVDWNAGIRWALERVIDACGAAERVRLDDAVAEYHRLEPIIQGRAHLPYRQVLDTALSQLADRFDLELRPQQLHALSDSIGDWPPFADTNAALTQLKRRYRLGILSNIDRDLFARTARQFRVAFDFVVTAEDVRAYKPAHAHFLRALAQVNDDRTRLLHVAQSLYHDCVPCKQLGIACVWINRLAEQNRLDAEPIAEFPELAAFADAIDQVA